MKTRLGRRKFLLYGSATLGTSLLLKACSGNGKDNQTTVEDSDTIKVGILHSLSGTIGVHCHLQYV